MKIKPPSLTTNQRISLTFSLYLLLLLSLIYGLIYLLFRFTISLELKNQLLSHSSSIISTHLKPTQNSYTFILDPQNRTLKEYMVRNQLAAVFLDNHLQETRKYGAFILPPQNPAPNDTEHLIQLIKSIPNLPSPHFQYLEWQEQSFFLLTTPIKNDQNQTLGYLILAKPLTQYQTIQKALFLSFLTLAMVSLLASFILGKIITKKALSPIEKLIATIQTIDLDKLDTQLTHSGHPQDILTQLINQFNHLIAKIQDMSNRQKEFIANASHELKTPLARVLSSLELIELNAHTPQTIHQLKQELVNLNQLIEQLLLLASITSPSSHQNHSIQLKKLIQKLIKQHQPSLQAKKLKISLSSIPTTITTPLTLPYLTIILTNLLTNAIKYSPPQTTIKLAYHHPYLSITNPGQLTPSEKRQLFQRFFRSPRHQHLPGHGLGLAIVKRILDSHHLPFKLIPHHHQVTFQFSLSPA